MFENDVDVACIQEVSEVNASEIKKFINSKGGYIVFISKPKRNRGIVFFSKNPIELLNMLDVPDNKPYPVVRTSAFGTDITLLGVHFSSLLRTWNIFEFAENYKLRLGQSQSIVAEMKHFQTPAVVMSDFNTTPTEHIVRVF
ncbi:MAG: hypothetical protein P9L92_01080 [Candidatus Electryonea clarkiae]|nr:hypothetical protein [Candidatus Electryonea clarkiae]MDP8289161.1 hypothetical protein [Candidatus Electryonea clarkiae]